MAKPKTQATNKTYEKLKGLPFENAGELKRAQDDITRAVWARLEYAKVLNELTAREEFKFWRKEFESGLACRYGGDPSQLVKVFSDGDLVSS